MARGISTATIARRAAALAIAAAAATGLSACGAGQVTQTDTKQTAIAGVNIDEGELSLRDLQVEYATGEGFEEGGAAPLRVWIANDSDESVSLTGIETDAAENVTLVDVGGPGVDVQETTEPPESSATSEAPAAGDDEATDDATEATTDGASDQATDEATDGATEGTTDEATDGATDEATDGATEGTTEAPTGEPTEDALTGSPEFDIEIAPHAFVRLDKGVEDSDYLLLEGLAEPLLPGQNITVTFVFSNGQEIAVELPVGQPMTGDQDDRSYLEHPGVAH
ncbi:hypothetical protein [Glycomyces arizonensis]|uniref:hypothetical protein n=1 Tax=Glycomyces arizonensis TaxID=256035 RepID=UPI000400C7EE|nr:hypothetical protein [Glycomyces arizonensis]